MKAKLKLAWYDLWIGAYWDRKDRVLYVCPIPTLLIEIRFGNKQTKRICDNCLWQHNVNCPNSYCCYSTEDKPYFTERR